MAEEEVSIDDLIRGIVDEIFEQYDTDRNGTLEGSEAKQFIERVLKETECDESEGKSAKAFEPLSDDDFDSCFREFDEDNNKKIEKQEMIAFIKKIAGY